MTNPMTSPNPARDEAVAVDTAAEMRHYMQTGEKVPSEVIGRWRALINKCEALSAANPPASGVDAVAELDAFYQGWLARWRDRLASLSPAATSGLAMPSREWMRDKVAADPDIEDCGAAPAPTSGSEAGGEAVRPEDEAEHFIQAAIDSAPEPLRRLGEWLANKLDDDDWKTADRLITGAAVSCASLAAELDQASGVIKDRNAELAALAKPASSPAGVREASLSRSDVCRLWQYAAIERPSMTIEGFTNLLLNEIDDRAEALSPSTSAAEPVAWMDDGSTRAGSHDTAYRVVMADTKAAMPKAAAEAYRTPLYATPPAPAAVDGQRVKR